MNIERIGLFFLIITILGFLITSRNHLTVNPECNLDNVRSSRQNIIPLGQDDEDVLVFVHVSNARVNYLFCSFTFMWVLGNLDYLDF
jgi:hypothetical protein